MQTLLSRFRREDRGQTLVEFALSSIVLFSVLFATIELGIAVWRYNMVADLAQEGARYATVHGKNSSSPLAASAVQTFVQTRAAGMSVSVTTTPAPSTLIAGETVTVSVQATYTPLSSL